MINCHHDHIPFKLKGNGDVVFSVRIRVCKSWESASAKVDNWIFVTSEVTTCKEMSIFVSCQILNIFITNYNIFWRYIVGTYQNHQKTNKLCLISNKNGFQFNSSMYERSCLIYYTQRNLFEFILNQPEIRL